MVDVMMVFEREMAYNCPCRFMPRAWASADRPPSALGPGSLLNVCIVFFCYYRLDLSL